MRREIIIFVSGKMIPALVGRTAKLEARRSEKSFRGEK